MRYQPASDLPLWIAIVIIEKEVMYLLTRGRRWTISIIVVLLILLSLLYVTMNSGIQLDTSIPTVFQGQKIQYEYKNGFTFIKGEQEHVNNPINHDDQALYVLNGATNEFKKFYIDSVAGELVIRQNIMSPKSRNKPYFQVVKVPNSEYKSIAHDEKVKLDSRARCEACKCLRFAG